MNLSGPWIRRPVMTTLVMLAILVFGVFTYRNLPVSDLPTIDYPTVSVSANLPGASPEVMASSVATPLEQAMATIPGIESISSQSTQGSTNINLQFTLSRDIDGAANDVQAAIAGALRSLPEGIQPPTYRKSNSDASPILILSMNSDQLSRTELNEWAETFLAQRLSTIEGVAQVQVYGSAKYAVRIQLDPGAMASRGIGIDEVQTAVSNGNSNLPAGVLMGPNQSFTVQANGQLQSAAAFRQLVVAYRNGAPVRLGDLGDVLDDVQNNRVASTVNGRTNIALAIVRQPGTNTVAVADAVMERVDLLKEQLPSSIQFEPIFDRAVGIRESVHDVQFTLVLTLGLVVLVIFLFLRNVRATSIPALALPFSIVGTFSAMWALGYSLNNLTLMALTLSVGFVVDDAIVMLENIVRHLEMGKTPMQAAIDGSREISFTILSITLSLVAVFIPIMFMPGLVGRLFQEFAVTIGVAILVSGFVSLTLTPMLCARWLRSGDGHASTKGAWRSVERVYQAGENGYVRSLHWVMKHRRATMAFSLLTLAATGWLFVAIPKGFLPSEDTGRVEGSLLGPEGIGFESMKERQTEVAAIVGENPYVASVLSSVGGGGRASTGNNGRLIIRLVARSERPHVDVVMRQLQGAVSQVPGMQTFFRNPPPISIGGVRSSSSYQITLQGTDIAELYTNARAFEAKMREIPLIEAVSSDLQIGNPQVSVDIDRERASALGVTAGQIERALYNAYGSRQVSTIFTQANQYWVIMELKPQYQRDVEALKQLFVRSDRGTLVPLGAVASFSRGLGPLSVQRVGQLPAVTISYNLRPGVALGTAVAAVEGLASAELPADITTSLTGDTKAFADAQDGLLLLLVVAVFVIYIVLGVLYESYIHPITILSGLPFAALGALATLMLFGKDLSVYAFVGVVLLVGLVKKNAIMMLDFAIDAERERALDATTAILEAARVRFRPIMMTTFAALMGTMPIAVGYGAGAESRQPLGLAVVGGMAFSQLVTLYVTPVIYTYFDQFVQWRAARRARSGARRAAVGEVVRG